VEVVASLSQGRIAAAQCGLLTHKSVPVIFEPPYNMNRQKKNSMASTLAGHTKFHYMSSKR